MPATAIPAFHHISLEPAHTQSLHSAMIELSRKENTHFLQDTTSNRSISSQGYASREGKAE